MHTIFRSSKVTRSAAGVESAALMWLCMALAACSGCITTAHKAIPIQHIPPELLAPSRSAQIPIDFTLLQQNSPPQFIVGPSDTLGIYVEDVLPADQEVPMNFPDFASPRYEGQTITPRVGSPVFVDAQGNVQLPFIEPIRVEGMTMPEVRQTIRNAYAEAGILKKGKENVFVGLIKPRYFKVTVIREDTKTTELRQKDNYVLSKRGDAQVLEMPAYENDVLHALSATGGLPGDDAFAHVWVLRPGVGAFTPSLVERIVGGSSPEELVGPQLGTRFTKIPLRVYPGAPIPFGRDEIILNDGDIVFVESRKTEFFYVGGYLEGGQIPLPRDYDLDILGAIAMANGAVGGPAGRNPGASAFRSGPGNIIPPSRAIIVRQYPNEKQLKIAVDLKRALDDPRERIVIQPGDLVMLQFTIPELLGNVALNFVNVNYQVFRN